MICFGDGTPTVGTIFGEYFVCFPGLHGLPVRRVLTGDHSFVMTDDDTTFLLLAFLTKKKTKKLYFVGLRF